VAEPLIAAADAAQPVLFNAVILYVEVEVGLTAKV
jgi:hypothetical protein